MLISETPRSLFLSLGFKHSSFKQCPFTASSSSSAISPSMPPPLGLLFRSLCVGATIPDDQSDSPISPHWMPDSTSESTYRSLTPHWMPDSSSESTYRSLTIHNRVLSLIETSDLDAASHLVQTSINGSFRPAVITCNAIIAAMHCAKRYNDAVVLFEFFFEQYYMAPDLDSYKVLINTYCDEGRVDSGLAVYRKIGFLLELSPVIHRHLTKGLIDAGRISEAVDFLKKLLIQGQRPDSHVYNYVIKGYLNIGNLVKANELFDQLKKKCSHYDGVVTATFMDYWFKQGKDQKAMEIYKSLMDSKKFKMFPEGCNMLLEVLLNYGKEDVASTLFEQMLDNHLTPSKTVNSDTFNIMVNYLFKKGKIVEAVKTFKKKGKKPGSKPFAMSVDGYNNIISKLCEKEKMKGAEKLFAELQRKKHLSPNATSFRALIDGYLKMNKVEDAMRVFEEMEKSGICVEASYRSRVFHKIIKINQVSTI